MSQPIDVIPPVKRRRVQTTIEGETRTKQAPKDEVNVNIIVENHRRTGALPSRPSLGQAIYGDFTSFDDFHSQANRMLEAQESFDALPATVRRALHDDPQELVRRFYSGEEADQVFLQEQGILPAPEPEPAAELEGPPSSEAETPVPEGPTE